MEKRLIVVTGASSGIGAAVAEIFKEKGFPLLALARRKDRLEKLEGEHVLCKKVDVADLSAFRDALLEAEKKWGPTDCLINNASVLYLSLFHEQKLEEIRDTLDINIMGTVNGMHLVLPEMVSRKRGTIFNICSVGGHDSYPTQAAYCASKFAIRSMTDSIRKEVSKYNVRLMNISPGAVETEVGSQTTNQALKREFDEMRKKVHPLEPRTIAEALFYAYQKPQSTCFRDMIIAPTPTVSEE